VTAFNGPTSSPPAAKGKNVYIINCSPDTEGCRRLSDANLAAAKAIGWTGSKVLATDGSVTQFNSAMRQAIQAGASGIIIDAFPSAAVSGPLATAASKGIPVIAEVSGDTTPNTGANFKGGLYTVVDGNNSHLGALAADWAIAQTKGKANVGSFEVASFPVLQQRYAGFQKAMSACTTCKVNSPVTVPLTSLTTQAAPAVAEFLRSHADVNYFFSTFDGGAILAAQGIRSAGSKVPMVSLEGNAPNLEMIRSGGPEVAVVALPLEWIGWAAIDEMNRAFNKQAPAPQWTPNGSGIPLKVVTKSNAPAKGQSYQGDIDFESAFKKLWQG
jgi:ribose transport system substrate-binding protein